MTKKVTIFAVFVILVAFLLLVTEKLFHWKRIIGFQESQLSEVVFVGRVVDQNNQPVPNATVRMGIVGQYLASGDAGNGSLLTDSDGYFLINNLRGSVLVIRGVDAAGYEIDVLTQAGAATGEGLVVPRFYPFKANGNALLWSDYTRANPYIIKAYKVGKYAQVKSDDAGSLGFAPDGSIYTVDFSGDDKVKFEGVREGDLRVSFTRTEKDWIVKIDAVDGGLQETSDEYMNFAPEDGYQQSLIYSGSTTDKYPVTKSIRLNKKIYFMSKNRNRYGSLKLVIKPYYNDRVSAIGTVYVINLEGGRELAVRPKE